MFVSVFALALTAHIVSDFLLQTDRMARKKEDIKEKGAWCALLAHTALTFVLAAAALYLRSGGWLPLAGAAFIAASHLGVDVLKGSIDIKKHRTAAFVLDQLLHLAAIAAAALIVSQYADAPGYYDALKSPLALPGWSAEADKAVWTAATAIACVWGGAHVIRLLLSDLNIDLADASQDPKAAHAGKWIGMLERMTLIILIPLGQWAAVGLLLTAKSIARHRNLDKQNYAEYYLVGTLLSFITAIAGGLVISGIWAG
ncbi:MAG: DUF3307 domain-containing protein [Burkholderiales bacterium]